MRNLAEPFVTANEEAAESKCGFLKGIVGIGQVEPAGETGFASGSEEFDGAQCGKFFYYGLKCFRLYGDPDAVVARCLAILFPAQEEDNFLVYIDGMTSEHRPRSHAACERRFIQFV